MAISVFSSAEESPVWTCPCLNIEFRISSWIAFQRIFRVGRHSMIWCEQQEPPTQRSSPVIAGGYDAPDTAEEK